MSEPIEDILDADACLALLNEGSVGRIAVNAPGFAPLIRPVSYGVEAGGRSIAFRSGKGSKLTALLLSGVAAFEIDSVDPEAGVAWSVIVQGQADEVSRPAEIRRLEALDVPNWAPGEKPYWIRLRPHHISGRRLTLGEGPSVSPAARPPT